MIPQHHAPPAWALTHPCAPPPLAQEALLQYIEQYAGIDPATLAPPEPSPDPDDASAPLPPHPHHATAPLP